MHDRSFNLKVFFMHFSYNALIAVFVHVHTNMVCLFLVENRASNISSDVTPVSVVSEFLCGWDASSMPKMDCLTVLTTIYP